MKADAEKREQESEKRALAREKKMKKDLQTQFESRLKHALRKHEKDLRERLLGIKLSDIFGKLCTIVEVQWNRDHGTKDNRRTGKMLCNILYFSEKSQHIIERPTLRKTMTTTLKKLKINEADFAWMARQNEERNRGSHYALDTRPNYKAKLLRIYNDFRQLTPSDETFYEHRTVMIRAADLVLDDQKVDRKMKPYETDDESPSPSPSPSLSSMSQESKVRSPSSDSKCESDFEPETETDASSKASVATQASIEITKPPSASTAEGLSQTSAVPESWESTEEQQEDNEESEAEWRQAQLQAEQHAEKARRRAKNQQHRRGRSG
jgi:hypothetical protein